MKRLICVMLIVMGGCASSSQKRGSDQATEAPPLLSYCQLMSSPREYLNQEVRLRTVYREGFEWQEAYSLHCIDDPDTNIVFDIAENCPKTIQHHGFIQDNDPSSEGSGLTLGVIFRGRLTGLSGGYGHLGAYSREFQVTCVEESTPIDLYSYHRKALTSGMRRQIEVFEKDSPR